MPTPTQAKRRIEVPGAGYLEMQAAPGQAASTEIFNPAIESTIFQGGGRMDIQKQPQGAPLSQLMQGDIPPGLQSHDRYEKFLQSKYGDPWEDERNLSKTVDKTARENEQQLFDHVFRGAYRYEDRRYLSKKALDYWQDSLLKLRKNIETQSKQDIAIRKDQLGEQMKVFDSYIKELKPAKPKEPTIADYKTFEEMVYNMTHTKDANGKTIEIPASDISMKAAKVIGEKLGILLEERKTPEKKGTGLRGFAWMGEPSAPAKTTLGVSKVESRNPGETPAQWRKRTGR